MDAAKKLEQAARLRQLATRIEQDEAELPDDFFEDLDDLLEAQRVLSDPTEERIPHEQVLAQFGLK